MVKSLKLEMKWPKRGDIFVNWINFFSLYWRNSWKLFFFSDILDYFCEKETNYLPAVFCLIFSYTDVLFVKSSGTGMKERLVTVLDVVLIIVTTREFWSLIENFTHFTEVNSKYFSTNQSSTLPSSWSL